MIIYTDDTGYAEKLFDPAEPWRPGGDDSAETGLIGLMGELFEGGAIQRSRTNAPGRWRYACAVQRAPRSQYDLLVSLQQRGAGLPDGIVCLAGSGREFHGQRGRPWRALEGNLHISIYLAPQRPVERFHIGFSILAAVSLVSAIDRFDPLRARAEIKWVNDVLVDGAKVAGFLAHTSSIQDRVTAAVLGIGLNVETPPDPVPDQFVPRAASLRDLMPDGSGCSQRQALEYLLESLDTGYRTLLDGGYDALLDTYRERSAVMGRRVRIYGDAPAGPGKEIAAGRVVAIGENLELYLDSTTTPVSSGRLVLEREHA